MRQKIEVLKKVEELETYERALNRIRSELLPLIYLDGSDCNNLNPSNIRDKDGYRCKACPLGHNNECIRSVFERLFAKAIIKCHQQKL
jgi:hypothetical protein